MATSSKALKAQLAQLNAKHQDLQNQLGRAVGKQRHSLEIQDETVWLKICKLEIDIRSTENAERDASWKAKENQRLARERDQECKKESAQRLRDAQDRLRAERRQNRSNISYQTGSKARSDNGRDANNQKTGRKKVCHKGIVYYVVVQVDSTGWIDGFLVFDSMASADHFHLYYNWKQDQFLSHYKTSQGYHNDHDCSGAESMIRSNWPNWTDGFGKYVH